MCVGGVEKPKACYSSKLLNHLEKKYVLERGKRLISSLGKYMWRKEMKGPHHRVAPCDVL